MQHFEPTPEILKLLSARTAERMLNFMYSACTDETRESAAFLELASDILCQFPEDTRAHHHLHVLAERLVDFFHNHYLLKKLSNPPAELVQNAGAYLRAEVRSHCESLVLHTDPAMVLYLDGFLDPALFPFNVPNLLFEVCFPLSC